MTKPGPLSEREMKGAFVSNVIPHILYFSGTFTIQHFSLSKVGCFVFISRKLRDRLFVFPSLK